LNVCAAETVQTFGYGNRNSLYMQQGPTNRVVFHYRKVEAVRPEFLVIHSIRNGACAHQILELLQSKRKIEHIDSQPKMVPTRTLVSMLQLNFNATSTGRRLLFARTGG